MRNTKNNEATDRIKKEGKFIWKGNPIKVVEILLKTPEVWFEQISCNKANSSMLMLFFISMFCYLSYSLIVGSYSGNEQWLAAPVKIISGTILSILLCYPSLYIFSCLAGADISPGKAIALLTSGMTLSAILLIGFAPVAFIFTFAIRSTFFMGLVHFLAWGISIYFGIRHISNGLKEMSSTNSKLIRVWGAIMVITMLQMTVTLRPILGEDDQFLNNEKRFFVEHWIENASPETINGNCNQIR